MEYIDLHTHSTYSDGTLTPGELLTLAKKRGLAAMAVTDHDTVAGTAEAIACGLQLGIEVISGIEISAGFENISMHLLGYGIRHDHSGLIKILNKLQETRRKRNEGIFKKLKELGIQADISEIQHMNGGQIGRPHIARLLVEKKVVKTIQAAFAKYLKKNALAYVSSVKIQAAEAIETINNAGGLPMLAHPACIDTSLDIIPDLLKKLRDLGLAGIEVYYPTHSAQVTKKLKKLNDELGLLACGGSDFHGTSRSDCRLGGSAGKLRIPYEVFLTIKQHLAAKRTA